MNTELKTNENAETAIASFDKTLAAVAVLEKEFEGRVYDPTTGAGMKTLKADRTEIVTIRTTTENIRTEAKKPLLAAGRLLDSKAKLIEAACRKLEAPRNELIKAEEQRKAAEKAERDRIEAERVQKIQQSITNMIALPSVLERSTADTIAKALDSLVNADFGNSYAEFTEQAEDAQREVVQDLSTMLITARSNEKKEADRIAQQEADDKRRAEERAELDKRQAEQDARQAKMDAEQAERDRVFEIKGRLQGMAGVAGQFADSSAEDIAEALGFIRDTRPNEKFAEFQDEAIKIWETTISEMEAHLAVAQKKEAEEKETAQKKKEIEITEVGKTDTCETPLIKVQATDEPEWTPTVYRLKKALLSDILATAVSSALSDADSLERIVATCKANLRGVK